MKKLYILIFFLVIGKSFGQVLQNANWIVGNGAGITFNTTLPTELSPLPSSVGFYASEGSAIVSDNDGNILFFTNGETVWMRMPDGSNEVIATGLFGDESSAQNAVIVHKPGSTTNYYIFTNRGGSGVFSNNRGLHYTEINFNFTDATATVVFQNKVLNDELGNPVTGTWNICEAITAVNHSDNYQYWVEAFVGADTGNGKILSYLVTDLGVIDENPESAEIFTPTSNAFAIKARGSHIAVATAYSGVYLGSFNDTTGNVDMNQSSPVGNYSDETYSLEFSPSGNNLYFAAFFGSHLMGVEVSAPTVLKTFTAISTPSRLQLGIDNKIYLITGFSTQHLSVLNTPNNILSPGFVLNSVQVSGVEIGLPQLVPIQLWDGPCVNSIKPGPHVYAPDIDTHQASNILYAGNVIYSGATAIYHAGNTVVFQPGFQAEAGSKFRAYIEGCSGEYVGRMAYSEEENKEKLKDIGIEKLKVYPNPSNSFTEISIPGSGIQQLTIFSIEGKMITTIKAENNQIYRLDTSNLSKGMYILSIETTDGKVHSEKLIKS